MVSKALFLLLTLWLFAPVLSAVFTLVRFSLTLVSLVLRGTITFIRRLLCSNRLHSSKRQSSGEVGSPTSYDPWKILGVSQDSTIAELRTAYRARLKEHHPDLAVHLCPHSQRRAHESTIEVVRAYKTAMEAVKRPKTPTSYVGV